MASLNRARLRRRLAVLATSARRRVAAREEAREYAAAWASLHAALAAAKIDPADIGCLRLLGDFAAPRWRLIDTLQSRQADAAFLAAEGSLPADEPLGQKAARRAADFVGHKPPDRDASLLDWYAWALAIRSTHPAPG